MPTTALELEKQLRDDPTVSLTLVSETNALLFTPMLAEVAASSLEPTHISTPLRGSLPRTRVVRAKVSAVDLDARQVHTPDRAETIPYDHLVLALGGSRTGRSPRLSICSWSGGVRIGCGSIRASPRTKRAWSGRSGRPPRRHFGFSRSVWA